MEDGIIPFVSSVTAELNERIDEIMTLINELADSMKEYITSVQDAINEIGEKIHSMLEESTSNKKYTSEAFSKIVKKIAIKLKEMSSKSEQPISQELLKAIEVSKDTINLLDEKMTDLQLIQVINGLDLIISRIDAKINAGTVNKAPYGSSTVKKYGIQTSISKSDSADKSEPVYYERGAKTKTMEEILEEQRKRRKLMMKYR